jgi:MFS family permease
VLAAREHLAPGGSVVALSSLGANRYAAYYGALGPVRPGVHRSLHRCPVRRIGPKMPEPELEGTVVAQRNQLLCAWSGLVFLGFWLIGFGVIAGFLPPPSPSLSNEQLAEYFSSNRMSIQIGIVISMVGTGFLGPWLGVLTVQMKRIEGRYSPLAYTNLGMSSMFLLVAFAPLFFIQVLEYRQDHTLTEIRLLSDMTWIPFIGYIGTVLVQWACLGLLIMQDDREHPIFPRWAGYLNFWLILLSAPACALYFFKTGPLAWNGVFSFWIPLVMFGSWILAMTAVMHKAIKLQANEPDRDSAGVGTNIAEKGR